MIKETSAELAEAPGRWDDIDPFRFFAYVFSPPHRDRFQAIGNPETQELMRHWWQTTGRSGEFPGVTWYSTYEEYESDYIGLFDVGMPEPPVALFESAHYKKIPAQETVLENALFYELLGLKSDPKAGVPDYLVAQLEFLSAVQYAREHAATEDAAGDLIRMERDFISRHLLNWVPLAVRRMKRYQESPFLPLMTLLDAFLKERLRCDPAKP